MGKSKHLKILRKEARKMLKPALVDHLKENIITLEKLVRNSPPRFVPQWIFAIAWRIVVKVPLPDYRKAEREKKLSNGDEKK